MIFNNISQVNQFLIWTKKRLSPAAQQAARNYWKKEMPRRFDFGNTNIYNYTPNTEKYEQRKYKKHGLLPQLVVSGKLRNSVVYNVKVNKFGISVSYPRYGEYQRNLGRNFLKFNKHDIMEMKRETKLIFRKWLKP